MSENNPETFQPIVKEGQKVVCSLDGDDYDHEDGIFSHDCKKMGKTFKFQNKPIYQGQHIIPGEDPGHYEVVDKKRKSEPEPEAKPSKKPEKPKKP